MNLNAEDRVNKTNEKRNFKMEQEEANNSNSEPRNVNVM